MPNPPRLLDLFCGAGGAAMGYHRTGFEVVGVDIEPQPNYPFSFIEDDALDMLARLLNGGKPGVGPLVAVHASPPCQDYSTTRSLHTAEYPRLIDPVRERLARLGLPYVIENVEGARDELRNPVRLCGSSFVTRHPGGGDSRKPRNLDHAREVMGIDWMTRSELSEAIPPAYTEWIGEQLLAHLKSEAAA